jgi:ParB family chromosome partitioning protein
MQNSSEFQYIAIDQIHESATNPRRTFDELKLGELAESIRTNGLIQPITVRPNNTGFEIVAGARRFRASQLAELFSIPARIVDISDSETILWQLVENSQRVDVHPYEEAQGFQRLLDMPGYDVATLVEKSGKSAAHVYARLSLLQLIPEVAEAFTKELITASHANLLARLSQEHQGSAYEQCWRKDWQDKEPHLAPAKHLAAWIQTNLYLNLAEAPFDKEDTTLNPPAGACVTCPRRSGYNTALFADVQSQGDQCLDAPCFHTKVNASIDREVAAHPDLIQIENGHRAPKEQRPGAVRSGTYREVENVIDNLDAEPIFACSAARPAIIVYGKRVGTTLTVCTDNDCPVHNPRAAARAAEHPAPVMAPAPPAETEEQAEERRQQYEAQRQAHQQEEERRAEERKQQEEREEKEREAAFAKRDKHRKKREATFERIVAEAPPVFTASQLRVILRALVNLDPYTFADDLAEDIADENEQRSAEEVLLSVIDGTTDDKLTSFAAHLALAGHRSIPRENELDFLTEAQAAFLNPKPKTKAAKKQPAPAKEKEPTSIKPAKSATKKKAKAEPIAKNAVAA